ncbi:glycerol-3-phosphate 1-O-acyltransferase PlsY [Erysipelothrix urinaevulpis]|uniref:glycerol-3-phosphate 1-O-acyltransferase PlsY n=1 Tax=Erysipelothrix urinaevulpis TaxID=2683717 RepID=UPI0013577735|nr:glycerol-3-phosphate 1-O-acyltransferase PlsY [Erysipelothrix urinaevulpis]
MAIFFAGLIGYLFGSIPFALVIGKLFFQTDIREHGSGNLGGTNAGRTLGPKAGISVAILDVLKATIAMCVAFLFFKDSNAILAAGFFATIGHCYPIFANFKGGKAVSTSFGFLLGITIFLTHNALLHFFLPLGIFFACLYLSKMVSLSAMISITSASIILFLSQSNHYLSIAFTIINLIVITRHKTNIGRIKNGSESKITWM